MKLPLVSFTPPPILGRLILDDLDGDSNTDIVRVEGRNSVRYVGWYQNQGSGGATSFAPVTRLSHYDLSASAITAADVNGDGDYEVIRGDTLAAGTLSIHFHGPAAPGRPIEVKWTLHLRGGPRDHSHTPASRQPITASTSVT
ncbi:FG-GAP repeat domain-containing protein [Saltatorellus ferox]|uniref:FG-GAP repeat domain-containing protein n=1 Tax=Saltatorellus ferox TaxID=2528018 RepID=UPI003AF3D0F4